MTPAERAEQANRDELEAERADLMRRALARVADKRADERARIFGMTLRKPATKRGRRTPRLHLYNGENLPIAEHAFRHGFEAATVHWRLQKGWTLKEALTTPHGEKRPSKPTDRLDPLTDHHTPGVPSDLGPFVGTGAGSTALEISNITFREKAEA